MTKKYILLFNGDELETKIYTHEEVEELHNASHYYYETYGYPTFTYGETKEETVQRALDYHSYTDINQLLERNGCETFEEFKEECIVEVKKHYFSCYEISENELIYIEELSNDAE
jgi:hypothetical protein